MKLFLSPLPQSSCDRVKITEPPKRNDNFMKQENWTDNLTQSSIQSSQYDQRPRLWYDQISTRLGQSPGLNRGNKL